MTTHREYMDSMTDQLQLEAKMVGLLPEGAKLHYQPGSKMNGVSPSIDTFVDGQMVTRPRFIPEFTYKTTRAEAEKQIHQVMQVFFALREKKEEDQRKATEALFTAE